MWTVIGSIVALVVGPLLALWIKNWLASKLDDRAAEIREAEEEKKAVENDKAIAQKTREANAAIDAQRAAREAYEKSLREKPKTVAARKKRKPTEIV